MQVTLPFVRSPPLKLVFKCILTPAVATTHHTHTSGRLKARLILKTLCHLNTSGACWLWTISSLKVVNHHLQPRLFHPHVQRFTIQYILPYEQSSCMNLYFLLNLVIT